MTLPANSRLLNIKRSLNKWLHTKLVIEPSSPRCFMNYGEVEASVPSGTDLWISIYWMDFLGSIFTNVRIQMNVMSKIQGDLYGNKVSELADYLVEALNYNTVPLYDFATPQSPVDLAPYCLIPRFDTLSRLSFPDQSPNRGIMVDYLIYMSRDGILP